MEKTLMELLIKHEGLELKPYVDTVGKITIGVGRNLTDLGITKDEALYLLQNDIERVRNELAQFDWYLDQDDVRKIVLIDMCFNLGLPRLLQFKKMIQALKEKDYEKAAEEMLDSKWARQVGYRAQELGEMMRTGELL